MANLAVALGRTTAAAEGLPRLFFIDQGTFFLGCAVSV